MVAVTENCFERLLSLADRLEEEKIETNEQEPIQFDGYKKLVRDIFGIGSTKQKLYICSECGEEYRTNNRPIFCDKCGIAGGAILSPYETKGMIKLDKEKIKSIKQELSKESETESMKNVIENKMMSVSASDYMVTLAACGEFIEESKGVEND